MDLTGRGAARARLDSLLRPTTTLKHGTPESTAVVRGSGSVVIQSSQTCFSGAYHYKFQIGQLAINHNSANRRKKKMSGRKEKLPSCQKDFASNYLDSPVDHGSKKRQLR